jgi:hypothetical protein
MASGKIAFSGGQATGLDDLAGALPAQINVLTDAAGSLRPRPGISAWDDFPEETPSESPVTQMGIWNGRLIYVTDDRKLWTLTAPGFVSALSDSTAATQLDGTLRPVITTTRTRAIITGGGEPQKWEGAGLSERLGGSPPSFSHTVAIAQRIIGNDSGVSGINYWSGVGETEHETWETGVNFAESEAKPDRTIALYESAGEVASIGTETIQMLSPDPTVVFSPSRTIPFGFGAAYSFVGIDEQFLGLDSKNRIMLSNGRGYSAVSTPAVAADLDGLAKTSRVDDCWGMRVNFSGWDLAAFQFPTAGKAMVYDVPSKAWSEWRGYAGSSWGPFPVTSHVYWPEEKLHLVGLANGRIAVLDPDATDDLGEPLVCEFTSPFTDHGSPNPKHCQEVVFRFRRGPTLDGAQVEISYRDDLGPFGAPFLYDLGPTADPHISIRSVGTYIARQWKIRVTSAKLGFAGAAETFTLVRT